MEMMVYLWLIFATVCFFSELGQPGLFFFLACSVGSLIAAFVALYDLFWVQCIAFLSTTFIIFKLLKRLVMRSKKHIATNVEALIGKKGVVTRSISSLALGEVKVQGELWSARTIHGQELNCHEEIEVVGSKGCHLIVKRFDERNAS